ncbi:MAG TPA: SMP-30/gluconolactonase/LRE family protein [Micropepsaceae bacterium]|nr:SMP-30/gluconolactonase/LRE family protein [Micropepsaceae bacterium]
MIAPSRCRLVTTIACTMWLAAPAPVAHARPMEIVATGLEYPEGPVLAPGGGILIADMELNAILHFNNGALAKLAEPQGPCGPTAIVLDPDAPRETTAHGRVLFSCHLSAKIMEAEREPDPARLRFSPKLEDYIAINRPNDMTGGRDGAFYVTSSGEFDPGLSGQGSVWFVNPHSRARSDKSVAEGFNYANGIALSPDERTLLVSEHFTNKVWRFAVAADGDLSAKTLFATLPVPEGASWLTGADGIEFIGNDAVAVAQYGAGRVFVFDMNGAVIAIHETPGYPLVTNLVMDPASQTLYATASRPKDGNPLGGHEGVLFALTDPLRP